MAAGTASEAPVSSSQTVSSRSRTELPPAEGSLQAFLQFGSLSKTPRCPALQAQQPREGDDVDPPLYCTDEFRIYYMKVSVHRVLP